ncbi:hypothetical protein DY245_07330 [Streptomyces inhibens]|uniref:Uncharacterized protein n=1 Tax=Streptomyces inhibens TaxID=2293571 RepID=A0A371Q8G6_STRIH|nr:hypothetical protein [Streptomyces inhibens]REK90982.1 hypothetical protein DY245_07330 [Streptomyces inhibens]
MTTHTAQPLGLGHWSHPLLGRLVIDHAHGDLIGILRAIAPDPKDSNPGLALRIPDAPPVAWLAPKGGGREWTTDPTAIEATR